MTTTADRARRTANAPKLTAMTQVHWLDEDQQASWRAYIQGSTLLLDRLDRELRQAHGIALAEYEILVRLSECPDRTMRMAVLADAMCHSRSRITHTVSRMEQAGLVSRCKSADDRRGIEATMTDKGYAVLVAAAPSHVTGVREHFVDLGSREDFAAMGRLMDAVCDRLRLPDSQAPDLRLQG